jgi:16S rRNA (cytosine967-C5)-methyltransferase
MTKRAKNLTSVDDSREQALLILVKVFENKAYSSILLKNLKGDFSRLDRAFITEIVYGTIKWKMKIDNIISQFSKIKMKDISPHILNILRIGIYQIDFMDRVPNSAAVDECVKLSKKYGNIGASKFVNAVLRNYLRRHDSIKYPDKDKEASKYLSIYYSYPEWMVSKLLCEFGESAAEDFLKSCNEVSPLTVRINSLKTTKEALRESLKSKGIYVSDSLYIDDALMLKNVPKIQSMDEYKKGFLTVQDESSMIAVKILAPKAGELVMDLCSAPGTKSTYMAEMMGNKGTVISGDINENKLKLVDQNAKRLGIDIISTFVNDAAKHDGSYDGKADRVLIDAPCSGLGVMRKKPEIRWNRRREDIEELKKIQRLILESSSPYVKLGGTLVYSTCTVLKEENIDLVRDFVRDSHKFVFEDITAWAPEKLRKDSLKDGYVQLFPNIDNVDGFFIARLKRVR